ncbi:MAG: helix-turn-helix domain-containing protein [Pseudomonadota bacterium]|nr:helix-turn-helix domain-containing protein [Pseudomonadota bacterium]
MTTQAISTRDALRGFDDLPDVARVRIPVVAALLSVGTRTVHRRVDAGEIPQPIKQGGVLTWRVGDLRSALGASPTKE